MVGHARNESFDPPTGTNAYAASGTWDSEGDARYADLEQEAADYRDVIEWAAGQPWSTGKVHRSRSMQRTATPACGRPVVKGDSRGTPTRFEPAISCVKRRCRGEQMRIGSLDPVFAGRGEMPTAATDREYESSQIWTRAST